MKPDESLFKAHLEEAPFRAGADAGKWGLHGPTSEIQWPNAVLWVSADSRVVGSGKVHLRFTLDGYPLQAPTSCPWDVERNARLDNSLWPKVPGKFAKVFRLDWKDGTALYAPCDRVAMPGHETWQQQFRSWWWQPQFTVAKYLEFVHLCLNPFRHEDALT